VALPRNGSVIGSGGTNGIVKLWGMEGDNKVNEIVVGSCIYDLSFSPSKFW